MTKEMTFGEGFRYIRGIHSIIGWYMNLYRGVTHQSITIGFGLRHIRLSHLVLGLHTLDYHTWSRPRTH